MNQVILKIKTAKKIAIFAHQRPDEDAIGSASALLFALKKMNKQVKLILETKLSNKLDFLISENDILYKFNAKDYDLLIAVDTASKELLGSFGENFIAFQNTVAVDHHLIRTPFAKSEFINHKACSCCEIIFNIIKASNVEINKAIATSLYTGICGDTSRFLHNNFSSNLFEIAKELMEKGAEIQFIYDKLYRSTSLNILKLQQIMLSNIELKGNVVCSYLRYQDYVKTKCNSNTGYEFIDIISSVSNADISFFVTENKPNIFNISFRSRPNIDISKIAIMFGGGGHKQASGAKNLTGSVESIKKEIFEKINLYKKEILN